MKRGFTLIEIMVVIVIMGILAAVGVPKLFGTIAKAKASEVPVAAGTYVKLQEAYLGVKPGPGSWKDIGYIAPGNNGTTANFCYSQGNLNEAVDINEIPAGTIGWGATNLVSLNDCGAHAWWSIGIARVNDNAVDYAHNISYEPCGALTSGWTVGPTLIGNCESASASEPPAATPESTPAPEQTPKPETQPEQETPPPPSSVAESSSSVASSSSVVERDANEQDHECGNGKKITDPRCCSGNNKHECVCGTGQVRKLGLSCN